MRTPDEDVAYEIMMRDGTWGMTGCLELAKAEVCLRGHDVLDDLTQLHVRMLALMCSGLNCNDSDINIHFNSDLESMSPQLEALDEAGFIAWNGLEYEASAGGREVTRQIGIEMLEMDRYRMKGELQASKILLEKLRVLETARYRSASSR